MIGFDIFKRDDWLADGIYPLIGILMEVFWVYPWLLWLGHLPGFAEPRAPVTLLSAILILFVAHSTAKFFSRRHWSLTAIRSAIIGCGVLVTFVAVRIEYGNGYPLFGGGWISHIIAQLSQTFTKTHVVSAAIPAVLFLWWRGILLERKTSSLGNIDRFFFAGIAAYFALVVVWHFTFNNGRLGYEPPSIGLYPICFFSFGLMALAVRNLYLKRKPMTEHEHKKPVWRSLIVMVGVIAAITVAGLITAAILSPDFFESLGNGARSIWGVLSKGLYYIIYPLLYVAAAVFWVMKWLIRILPKGEPVEMQGFDGGLGVEIESSAKGMPTAIITALELAAAAALAALLVFILAKAIKRFRNSQFDEIEEVHESVLTLDALRNDLEQLLKSVGRLFRRKQRSDSVSFDEEVENLTVRDIYVRLLWEGSRKGVTRSKHETPIEYAGRLKRELSDGDHRLYEITDLYGHARYGEEVFEDDRLREARRNWVILREEIRAIGDSEEP